MSYILYSVLILILFFGLFQDTIEHLSKGVLEGETKEDAIRRFREGGYKGDIEKIKNIWHSKSKLKIPKEGAKRITIATKGTVTKKKLTKNIIFMIILCLIILVIIVIVTIKVIKKFKMKEI
jgi:hypothetical protein